MIGGIPKNLFQRASGATETDTGHQAAAGTGAPIAPGMAPIAESKSRSQVRHDAQNGRYRALAWLETSKARLSGVLHASSTQDGAGKLPASNTGEQPQVYPEMTKITVNKKPLQQKIQEIEQALADFSADQDIQALGEKISTYYACGLEQADKLESKLFSHVKFSPDQDAGDAVANARAQQHKDPNLVAALAAYDKSMGNSGYRSLARKFHVPLRSNTKKSELALEALRMALRDFTRTQAAAMMKSSAEDVLKASSHPTDKACLRFLQDEYAKTGAAVFDAALGFVRAVSPQTDVKFIASLMDLKWEHEGESYLPKNFSGSGKPQAR